MEATVDHVFEVDFKSPIKSPLPPDKVHLFSPLPGISQEDLLTQFERASDLHEQFLKERSGRGAKDVQRSRQVNEKSIIKQREELEEKKEEYKKQMEIKEKNREKTLAEKRDKAAAKVSRSKEVAARVKQERRKSLEQEP
ncbi:hypothetical protein DFA_07757 [Cavenderia fasciculata]|uniref:Uncharacterized protein n=1 Tax=Cavenderia fasciculata TaxID=261658 RepID=F4Q357_CACFS|nr:uncharacterized protein DFA_07757 [Cavenderia fasciculata]EGG16779.1 hypothetical protein DFA_07757 [Cavenderia fasciculata]|eukprot:XP_004355253.1 hypothetical protein DFA_07757 [Cavenderia fasciculata]